MVIKPNRQKQLFKPFLNKKSENNDFLIRDSFISDEGLTHKDILDPKAFSKLSKEVEQKAENKKENEEINDSDIEKLHDKIEGSKLIALKFLENKKYTEKELVKALKELNFTDKEIDIVSEQVFARYKLDEKDIDHLKDKIPEDKLQFLMTLKGIEFTEEELEGNLNHLHFNKEEIQLVEKEAKEKPWIKDTLDFLNTQSDILLGFKVMGKSLAASAIGSGFAMVGLGVLGTMDLKEGLKEKDGMKIAKGVSALIGSAAALGDLGYNSIDGLGLKGRNINLISNISDKIAIGFGAACGTLDMVLGSINLVKGIKEKDQDKIVDSSFDIGLGGVTIFASFSIGGPVTAAALLGLFAAKVGYDYRENFASLGKKISGKIKGEEKLENNNDNKTKT